MAAGRPGEMPERLAGAVVDRLRAGEPARGEVLDEIEEERQVAGGNALFVKGEDEETRGGMQQEVGVLYPFGDPLVGEQAADVVAGEESLEFLVGDVGIDGHRRSLRLFGRLAAAYLARQRKKNARFLDRRHGFDAHRIPRREGVDDFLDQHFRG